MQEESEKLNNTYFALRHGKSLANVEGIIVSDPSRGISNYGLAEEGREQVYASVLHAKEDGMLDSSTIIFSSDFARAKETAEIASQILGSKDIFLTQKLRERFFGQWETTSHSNYEKVWDLDRKDQNHKNNDVESTSEVLARTTQLIGEIENKYSERTILLVSHGDTLDILRTSFDGAQASSHSERDRMQTAEIRRLN